MSTIAEDSEVLDKHDRLASTLWETSLKENEATHELQRMIGRYSAVADIATRSV
ncbi:hypothetical protein [Paraburkholderia fungorum]|uniref:hypothetical protein n=1 Tax=Paraburkholderia fungorum TaxID=134537 RepID=UPI001496225B|nr:hypothetical protein [Paraburkholderia fungorum]